MKIEGDNSFGLASVILGIVSLGFIFLTFFAFLAPLVGLSFAIIAFIFARKQNQLSANKWSKAGKIISIVSIILNGLIVIWGLYLLISAIREYNNLCEAAGGCDKIFEYLQSQQLEGLA
jgi:Na+/H+ antiporter NhaD/arsenite permease-like protein